MRKPQQVRDYYTYPGKEYRASYNDNLEKSIEASDHSTLNSTSKISLTNGLGTGRPARGLTRSQTQVRAQGCCFNIYFKTFIQIVRLP